MSLSPTEIETVLAAEAGHECPGVGENRICVRIVAIADLPSRFGRFQDIDLSAQYRWSAGMVVSRLRKFSREQASRALDDASWATLLHEKLKGPLADIMTLLALHARPMFVQKEKDLGLNPKRDELDVQGSMLFFANMFKYVERTLGFRGLRLFRKEEVPSRLQLVPTEPPGFLASEELFRERPKKELWFAIAKAMAFARPELFLARLMPHDQLDLVFQAACSLGTSKFVVTADPHLVEKLKRELERTLPENVRKNTLKLLARSYCEVQHPGDVRAYLDGAELTSNRAASRDRRWRIACLSHSGAPNAWRSRTYASVSFRAWVAWPTAIAASAMRSVWKFFITE